MCYTLTCRKTCKTLHHKEDVMRRGGFTLIELIFVIVILGILAAVALPKFIGVSEQAHEGKLKAFVGSLNRTVGPTLWSKAISNDGTGRIANLSITNNAEKNLSAYIDLPIELTTSSATAPDITQCNSNTQFKQIAVADATVAGKAYVIKCRDGNATHAPAFQLVDPAGNVLTGPTQ